MFEQYDPAMVAFAFSEIQGWLGVKLRTGRASFGLVSELAFHFLNRQYDVHTIYDEIGILEETDTRISSAKGASQFKHEPLKGLWYKHHNQAFFLAQNLVLEMKRASTVDTFFCEHVGGEFTPELIRSFVHQLVSKNYHKRTSESRLTGEWIIYESVNGANYYLTLGQHDEGDERIKERIDRYRSIDTNPFNGPILITKSQKA